MRHWSLTAIEYCPCGRLERVEPVAGRHFQVVQTRGQVDVLQLARGPPGDVGRKPLRPAGPVELLGVLVGERLDHGKCNVSRDSLQVYVWCPPKAWFQIVMKNRRVPPNG